MAKRLLNQLCIRASTSLEFWWLRPSVKHLFFYCVNVTCSNPTRLKQVFISAWVLSHLIHNFPTRLLQHNLLLTAPFGEARLQVRSLNASIGQPSPKWLAIVCGPCIGHLKNHKDDNGSDMPRILQYTYRS